MFETMNRRGSGVSWVRGLCGAVLVVVSWQLGACGGSDGPTGAPSASLDAGADAAATTDPAGGSGGTNEPPSSSPDAGVTSPEEQLNPTLVTGCTPGTTQSCRFEELCTGVATCAPDGSAFGACDCGALSTDVAGIIGARCESDGDCAGGARCLSASGNDFYGAGGAAGGYCTFECTDTVECTDRDPFSTCSPVGPDGASICIRTCLSGEAEPGEAKCLNRPDVACESLAAQKIEPFNGAPQLGFCVPRCGSDEECPAGRFCHRQAGICTDFRSPGASVGAACSTSDACDGRECEGRVDGVGTCTAHCVLGSLSGCGYGRDAASRDAACVVPVVAAGNFSEGPGDLGFCLELCDLDADCQQADAGFGCRPLSPGLATFLGRSGACARGAGATQ